MLVSNTISRLDTVWEKCWEILSENALYTLKRDIQLSELQVSDMELRNFALTEIDKILRNNGRTLMDFPPLPVSYGNSISNLHNLLILDQLNFDMKKGTGKTYIWRALTATLRATNHIVLTVESSGIASILLPGGRTAHSHFAILLLINEDSTCNIKQGSPIAEFIRKTKLIIWDEAVMMNKYYFEAVDKSLRDIQQLNNPNSLNNLFGRIVIVLLRDFRQILHVNPKGTRSDIVFAAHNSSYLWNCCKVFNLTQNIRLWSQSSSHNEDEVKEFADWLINVVEEKVNEPNDGEVEIEIPNKLLIIDFSDPIATIISCTCPSLQENYINVEYLKDRVILAPTLEIVEQVNQHIVSQLLSEER
ncbi:ATP-dependent DNA helicase pif1 [Senna tora]|uniref:ATP-dependent DNA helicase n=1 Tax=Senna tora TaxID=362788 RepID=A0A834XHH9_9FABA|nr:ATP-dependent DNA helicase pif1 [Senna tora]